MKKEESKSKEIEFQAEVHITSRVFRKYENGKWQDRGDSTWEPPCVKVTFRQLVEINGTDEYITSDMIETPARVEESWFTAERDDGESVSVKWFLIPCIESYTVKTCPPNPSDCTEREIVKPDVPVDEMEHRSVSYESDNLDLCFDYDLTITSNNDVAMGPWTFSLPAPERENQTSEMVVTR